MLETKEEKTLKIIAIKLGDVSAKVRRKGFISLQNYLRKYPEKSKEDSLKLWKICFYAIWLADKPVAQCELAVRMCSLHRLIDKKCKYNWIYAFYVTVIDQWPNLDRIRLDKYLLLLRIFQAEIFYHIASTGWNHDEIKALNWCLAESGIVQTDTVMNTGLGVSAHFCDTFLDELRSTIKHFESNHGKQFCNNGNNNIISDAVILMLEPIFMMAARSSNRAILDCIHSKILWKMRNTDVDLNSLVTAILRIASDKGTLEKNRRLLYGSIKRIEQNMDRHRPSHAMTDTLSNDDGKYFVSNTAENGYKNICCSNGKLENCQCNYSTTSIMPSINNSESTVRIIAEQNHNEDIFSKEKYIEKEGRNKVQQGRRLTEGPLLKKKNAYDSVFLHSKFVSDTLLLRKKCHLIIIQGSLQKMQKRRLLKLQKNREYITKLIRIIKGKILSEQSSPLKSSMSRTSLKLDSFDASAEQSDLPHHNISKASEHECSTYNTKKRKAKVAKRNKDNLKAIQDKSDDIPIKGKRKVSFNLSNNQIKAFNSMLPATSINSASAESFRVSETSKFIPSGPLPFTKSILKLPYSSK